MLGISAKKGNKYGSASMRNLEKNAQNNKYISPD
jgi:hypothetical protein